VALLSELVVIVSAPAETVSVSARVVLVETASVTRTVKFAVPAAVGVPLKTPPLERLRPDGRLPE
jgi:hypothetical protein